MIAATYTQGDGLAVRDDVPVPEIGADEVLLKVMASSICGTDIRIARNGQRKLATGQTVILGHEFAGIIEKCGSAVTLFEEGAAVGVAPNMGCGQCNLCIQGLPNMCPDYDAYGINLDGGHAEYVRITARSLAQGSVVALPKDMPFESASLIEPLSCAISGIRNSRIAMGDTVLIIGAGPIGLLLMQLARQTGAGKVIMADTQSSQLAVAEEVGGDVFINPGELELTDAIAAETGGRGVDAAITACSVAKVQQQALELLAPFGRLCFFGGLPKGESMVPLDTNLIHYKNLVVTGMTGGAPKDFRLALELIGARRIDLSRIVSHAFATEDMAEAFDKALTGKTGKIVIRREKNRCA